MAMYAISVIPLIDAICDCDVYSKPGLLMMPPLLVHRVGCATGGLDL